MLAFSFLVSSYCINILFPPSSCGFFSFRSVCLVLSGLFHSGLSHFFLVSMSHMNYLCNYLFIQQTDCLRPLFVSPLILSLLLSICGCGLHLDSFFCKAFSLWLALYRLSVCFSFVCHSVCLSVYLCTSIYLSTESFLTIFVILSIKLSYLSMKVSLIAKPCSCHDLIAALSTHFLLMPK